MTDETVHVVDDDCGIRRALNRLLRSFYRYVPTYSSAQEFLTRSLDRVPACVLLDLQMPDMNGFDLQLLLAHGHKCIPIIFLSGHGDIPASVRAMKAGAVDFLMKPFDKSELLPAIESALARSRQACLTRDALDRDRALFETLSQRERQVCLRVAQGMLNKQIAAELGNTEKTVKVQRSHVMEKLAAGSAADVVRLVERLRNRESPANSLVFRAQKVA